MLQGIKDSIIRFLGGCTEKSFGDLVDVCEKDRHQADQWREQFERLQNENNELHQKIALKDERIEVLIQMVIAQGQARQVMMPQRQDPPSEDAIRLMPQSWPRAQRELERKDRESLRKKSDA